MSKTKMKKYQVRVTLACDYLYYEFRAKDERSARARGEREAVKEFEVVSEASEI